MPRKPQCPIPDEILIPAAWKVAEASGIKFDGWGEAEKAACRKECGEEWAHIETDIIGKRAINLRKQSKFKEFSDPKMARKARPNKKNSPPWYLRYLKSLHWKNLVAKVHEWWGLRCAICGKTGLALEVHHNTYKNLGHEDFQDVVPLCVKCHKRNHEAMPDPREINEEPEWEN